MKALIVALIVVAVIEVALGVWAVGIYAANAVAGVLVFRDTFSWRTALGIITACVTVVLLKPTE